jgi:hypothetical protein
VKTTYTQASHVQIFFKLPAALSQPPRATRAHRAYNRSSGLAPLDGGEARDGPGICMPRAKEASNREDRQGVRKPFQQVELASSQTCDLRGSEATFASSSEGHRQSASTRASAALRCTQELKHSATQALKHDIGGARRCREHVRGQIESMVHHASHEDDDDDDYQVKKSPSMLLSLGAWKPGSSRIKRHLSTAADTEPSGRAAPLMRLKRPPRRTNGQPVAAAWGALRFPDLRESRKLSRAPSKWVAVGPDSSPSDVTALLTKTWQMPWPDVVISVTGAALGLDLSAEAIEVLEVCWKLLHFHPCLAIHALLVDCQSMPFKACWPCP